MARPRTAVETAGKVALTGQAQDPETGRWKATPAGARPSRWRARTKYRDADGVLRDVERFAATKAKAEAALKIALKERHAPVADAGLRSETAVEDAADFWLRQVERDSDLSGNTRSQYRSTVDRCVRGSMISGLTLREVNRVAILERYLQAIADERGTGSAKSARSAVSGILRLAVRHGVIPHNAMRDCRSAKAKQARESERDTSRAFTTEELVEVKRVAMSDDRAKLLDVTDVILFLSGTGVRISEALTVCWEDVDLAAGTVHVRGTKTAASDRVLSLPSWLAEVLTKRADEMSVDGLLFPSPGTGDRAKVRDLRNVSRVIRSVLDAAACPWATSHTFRRSVATILGDNGLPLRTLADQLGHADASMTARVYLGRRGDLSAAAAVL